MAEEYYENKKSSPQSGIEPSLLFLFDNGYSTTMSGWGNLYDHYCNFKQLGQYTGRNVKPRQPSDTDYCQSRLHIMPFDHAFKLVTTDITKR